MVKIHKQLHDLESQLIEIYGLMEALQILLPDSGKHMCVANVLEQKLGAFQRQFYKLWDNVATKTETFDKEERLEE